jgi:hypothetical protein
MKTKSVKPIVYVVVALMLATSITYLIVAVEESSEINNNNNSNNDSTGGNITSSNDNSNEKSLSNTEAVETKTAAEGVGGEGAELLSAQIETTLFAAASAGYLSVVVWMLKKKENTKVPYLIAVVGSLSLIILYALSRMISLPIVGLQEDIGFMDIISKILQGGIIAGCLYILMPSRRLITKDMTIKS